MKFSLSFFFLVFLWSCSKKQETVQPLVEDITESVYASGIIKSKNQYNVYSTVNGLIERILVKEGDIVQKGQALIQVADETSQLATANARLAAEHSSISANADKLNELKINIELAKAKVQNDSLLLARQRNLWAQQIGTRNELEQRELAYKNSVTAHESALLRYNDLLKQLQFSARQSQNNLQISTKAYKDYAIKSETAGRVYKLLKEPGEMVNTQSPVAIVGDADNFILELQVDEYDIARIRIGQQVMITMDSYKQQVFEATVTKIDPIMDDRSRSFTVEAEFTKRPAVLYPNLSAEANIVIQTRKKALTIPRTYLIDDQYVLTANKEKKKIVTGLKDYQKVEVISGLSASDVIYKQVK
jgi:multidrug efflux pump subunit AcrA (membrane-fusion protein)